MVYNLFKESQVGTSVFYFILLFFLLDVVFKSSLCLFGKYRIVCRRVSLEYVNTKC